MIALSFPSPITIENFEENSFKISYGVFDSLSNSTLVDIKEAFVDLGSERIYEDIKFCQKIILNASYFQNEFIIRNYFVWRMKVLYARDISSSYIKEELEQFKTSSCNHLYLSHASEIVELLDWCIENLDIFSDEAKKNIDTENYDDEVVNITNLLLDGDKDSLRTEFFKNIKFHDSIFAYYDKVISKAMHLIGAKWEANEISVAKEHLATSIMFELYNEFSIDNSILNENVIQDKPLALVCAVGDEPHVLALELICGALKKIGFRPFKLNSKLEPKDFLHAIDEFKPKLVVLSVTVSSNIKTMQEVVFEIKNHKSNFSGLIAVGGQALFVNGKPLVINGADLIAKSVEELEIFCKFNKDKGYI